jgi:alpha-keto-acid decarboxylase
MSKQLQDRGPSATPDLVNSHTLVDPDRPPNFTVGDYLLRRVAEAGAEHIFGVPGDFTLRFLDHVVSYSDIEWVGCTNELNAAYAADGYARVRGFATLSTTFGVGELSAINGIAGSYAEHVPVLEIVGGPPMDADAPSGALHHTLGDGRFDHFMAMHEPVTCASARLGPVDATAEIDRVITAVLTQRRPGYLLLPADVAAQPAEPPVRPLAQVAHVSDGNSLEEFERAVNRFIDDAGPIPSVSVLTDMLVHRFGQTKALHKLLGLDHVTGAVTAWGKGAVEEGGVSFLGLYIGALSEPAIRDSIEQSDVLVLAGVEFTDLTSGGFTQRINRSHTIDLRVDSASVGAASYPDVALADSLGIVHAALVKRELNPNWKDEPVPAAQVADSGPLTQENFWNALQASLRPDDLIVADAGTAMFGAVNLKLAPNSMFLSQPLWASIGYSIPALLGGMLAAPDRRGVVLVGDGAAQMTVQELSTFFRLGLRPVIVVLENGGYTIERAIHGREAPYNDIARWDWCTLAKAMAPHAPATTYRATTVNDITSALHAAQWHGGPLLIEACMDQLDAPPLVDELGLLLARNSGSENAA